MPRKTRDLAGERFGRLTAVGKGAPRGGRTTWACACDCGNVKEVLAKVLISGAAKSCGCLKRELSKAKTFVDMTGEKYGHLTVIREDKEVRRCKSHQTWAYWVCKCDCGKIVSISGASLRTGNTKSCGCLRKKLMSKPFGVAAFNDVLLRTKKEAESRGIEWGLTEDEVRDIHKQSCFYCGIEPSNKARMTRGNGGYVYNGIDRVDSSLGYTPENVVACCKQCNRSKSSMRIGEFKQWVARIYRHMGLVKLNMEQNNG